MYSLLSPFYYRGLFIQTQLLVIILMGKNIWKVLHMRYQRDDLVCPKRSLVKTLLWNSHTHTFSHSVCLRLLVWYASYFLQLLAIWPLPQSGWMEEWVYISQATLPQVLTLDNACIIHTQLTVNLASIFWQISQKHNWRVFNLGSTLMQVDDIITFHILNVIIQRSANQFL